MKSPLVKQTQCLPTFILDFWTDVQSPANANDTATWLLIRQRSPYSLSNSRICTWGARRLPTLCDRTAGQDCLVGRNANQLFTCDPQPLRFRRTEQIKIIPDYTPSPQKNAASAGSGCPEEAGKQRVRLLVNLGQLDRFRFLVGLLLDVRLILIYDIIYRPDLILSALRDSHARW